jgi:hypothetical protein
MTESAAFRARLQTLRESHSFRTYERVRDWVLEARAQYPDPPSAYWQEELETLEHMLDASPLVIDRLRQHTWPVTGIRAYEYRTGKNSEAFAAKLAALVELGGNDLLVAEPDVLGGFGFELEGRRFNIDTLKFYEVLIALERGAVLPMLRDGEPRTVLEIGSGWGGFASQVKTLFPQVTYVMVDLPELFLFSATYLLSLFPDAPAQFFGEGTVDWQKGGFVFVPSGALEELTIPQVDLTVNMVSFQEMTSAQVERYARLAWESSSPFLYSLNREHSLYNTELDSVSASLERYYWLHTIPVLDVSYLKMLGKPAKGDPVKVKKAKAPAAELDYKHVVGKRRVAL